MSYLVEKAINNNVFELEIKDKERFIDITNVIEDIKDISTKSSVIKRIESKTKSLITLTLEVDGFAINPHASTHRYKNRTDSSCN